MNYLTGQLKIVAISFIAIVCVLNVNRTLAQQTSSMPTPSATVTPLNPRSSAEGTPKQQTVDEQRRRRDDDFVRLRGVERAKNGRTIVFTGARRDFLVLYRNSTKKELKALAVNPENEKKFEAFLKQEKTGIFKLIEDMGCSENVNVVVATEDCLKYSMPGNGSSYSFRVKDYRIPRLADLTFAKGILQIPGTMVHGILTGIGDVPLEKVTLQNISAKYVVNFQPVVEYEEALSLNRQLTAGLNKDGYLYSRELNAVDNMTYILRSVAYEGEAYRVINGVVYNELEFDKRRDVTIAFKIVSREPGKSITILWKELENKSAPKMKAEPGNRNQIKENNFVANSERK